MMEYFLSFVSFATGRKTAFFEYMYCDVFLETFAALLQAGTLVFSPTQAEPVPSRIFLQVKTNQKRFYQKYL
jgi:hypothetical protein